MLINSFSGTPASLNDVGISIALLSFFIASTSELTPSSTVSAFNPNLSAISAYLTSALNTSYLGKDANLEGLVALYLTVYGSKIAFAVSVSNGLFYKNFRKTHMFLSSLTFGLFQGLMPAIGFLAGNMFFNFISTFDHWIALILLGFIGGNMIKDAIDELKEKDKLNTEEKEYDIKTMLLQGVATSIDALAVGISFAALNTNILTASLLICGVTFGVCLIGNYIGKNFGHLLKEKAKIFGGVILIFIGIKIFIEHMWL